MSTSVNDKSVKSPKPARAAEGEGTGAADTGFEPPYPGVVATAFFSLWVAILSVPMLRGAFLATPVNDQYSSGYAYREWAAQWWKELGHVPLWNPEIFGGMPFVAGMHGDIFYPTAWLRLILPIHVAMNLGFVMHYVLAGVFTYWFLRRWNVSWAGAVAGGLAYQLSGVIGSYVSPGHDGKLFVTALLPLMLVALTLAIRDRRWEGYAVLALAVGLSLLSPHPQMAQYALLAAGIFTLYLAFGRPTTQPMRDRLMAVGLALLAVLVGVGLSAIQYLPFYAYIPYSPRAGSVLTDFEFSTSYAIPWVHVPEFLVPRFTGEAFNSTYWGPNGTKLHSEYLGLAALGLAVVGVLDRHRRRFVYWLGGIALLFLLVALGSATPFYRIWWEVVPFAQSMRAPGMALFVVSFVVATFAAFGTDRLLTSPKDVFPAALVATGLTVGFLGATGILGAMAESLAQGIQMEMGVQGMTAASSRAAESIRWGAVGAGLALGAVGFIGMALQRGAIQLPAATLALIAIVGTDMWLNARVFWNYSRAHEELFADDEIKGYLRAEGRPLRIWDFENVEQRIPSVYPGAAVMAHDISQLYGHHGNELYAFDELHGRIGTSLSFRNAGHPQLLDLYAVNHILIHSQVAPDSLPGFTRALQGVTTSSGATATLFQRDDPISYARFVPAGVKAAFDETVATVLDQRFPVDRVVLLDTAAAFDPEPVPAPLPEPSPARVDVEAWTPGAMTIRINGGAPDAGYVLISENHYKNWRATVDGSPAPVVRTDGALMSVPVEPGAQEIRLEFVSPEYAMGKTITLASLVFVLAGFATPIVMRRKGGG